MTSQNIKTFIALNTVLRKEIVRFLRIWSQTLFPPVITMSLYFIIFGKLIGSQLNTIDGYHYMQYIVPGLIMMSIITNSFSNTATSFFGAKFTRNVEEMLVSSMPMYIILLGYMFGGALRGLLVGGIVFLISLFFTEIHIQHIYIVIAMAVLAALLFSLAGLINSIYAKNFDNISFIPTFVLTPLTYLGGVFYSLKQLPPTWQKISVLNPILNIVDTFRFGMLGVSDLNIYFGFGLVGFLFIIMFVYCLIIMEKGVGLRS